MCALQGLELGAHLVALGREALDGLVPGDPARHDQRDTQREGAGAARPEQLGSRRRRAGLDRRRAGEAGQVPEEPVGAPVGPV